MLATREWVKSLLKKLNIGKYSNDEVRIGTWIDGSPVYRKVIEFGELPKNTIKKVNHNITGISKIVNLYGVSKNSTSGNTLTVPYTNTTTTSLHIALYANDTEVCIGTNSDGSGLKETYVIMEYTK